MYAQFSLESEPGPPTPFLRSSVLELTDSVGNVPTALVHLRLCPVVVSSDKVPTEPCPSYFSNVLPSTCFPDLNCCLARKPRHRHLRYVTFHRTLRQAEPLALPNTHKANPRKNDASATRPARPATTAAPVFLGHFVDTFTPVATSHCFSTKPDAAEALSTQSNSYGDSVHSLRFREVGPAHSHLSDNHPKAPKPVWKVSLGATISPGLCSGARCTKIQFGLNPYPTPLVLRLACTKTRNV